jgi:hypothetical protein
LSTKLFLLDAKLLQDVFPFLGHIGSADSTECKAAAGFFILTQSLSRTMAPLRACAGMSIEDRGADQQKPT